MGDDLLDVEAERRATEYLADAYGASADDLTVVRTERDGGRVRLVVDGGPAADGPLERVAELMSRTLMQWGGPPPGGRPARTRWVLELDAESGAVRSERRLPGRGGTALGP